MITESASVPHHIGKYEIAEPLGAGADIHALGAVLFELIAGRGMFEACDAQQLFRTICQTPAPRVSKSQLGVPQRLAPIWGLEEGAH